MYEQFYGFKNAPFRLSPDPAFFFGSPGHKRALAYLRYGLNQKEGFIVITGAPGTGKTTLARALLQEIGRDKVVVAELNTTHLDPDDVLRMVAASFGLDHEGLPKATLLKRLESFFISRSRAGYHVLLLVDEAQNLPYGSLEELRMLSNFYLGKDALIQIFLLGQEQFRNSLYSNEMEQLRQRVVASSHLDPLNQAESRDYIEHRLRLSGWSGNPQITDRAFARIFSLTKGVPRRINTFCERLLLYGSLEQLTTFHDDTVKAVAKELMYEVSAKGVKLSDIKPGVPGALGVQTEPQTIEPVVKAAEEDATDVLDSEMLSSFSDDVAETSAEKAEPTSISQAEPTEEDSVFEDTTDIEEDIEEPDDESFSELQKSSDEKNGGSSNNTDSSPLKPKSKPKPKPKDNGRFPLRIVSNGNTAENQHAFPQTETPRVDTKPDWWELVALAIRYHDNPDKFKSIASSKTPVPFGIIECFKIAIGKMHIPDYLRTGDLSNKTDQDIREALRYYIKNVLLSNTADYYRRLGVTSGASFEEIRTHYKYLFRLFQPDKEQNATNWDETYTRRINQSYGTLRSTEKRKEYDEFLAALNSRNSKQDTIANDTEVEDASIKMPVANNDIEDQAVPDRAEVTSKLIGEVQTDSGKKGFPLSVILAGVVIVAIGVAVYVVQPDFKAILGGSDNANLPLQSQPAKQDKTPLPVVEPEPVQTLENLPVEETADEIQKIKKVSPPVVSRPAITTKRVEPASVVTKKIEPVAVKSKTVSAVNVRAAKELKPAPAKIEKLAVIKPLKKEAVDKKPASTSKVKVNAKVDIKKDKLIVPVVAPSLAVVSASKVVEPMLIGSGLVQSLSANGSSSKPAVTKPLSTAPKSNVEKTEAPKVKKPKNVTPKKSKRITQKRLNDFVTDFSLAYEEGDLDAFMTFFSEAASTNDAKNKLEIRQDYENLFGATEMRVIDLENLNWKIKKQKAVGKGEFEVTVLGRGAAKMKNFSGLIKLEVVRVGDKLKLKGMFHAYGANE